MSLIRHPRGPVFSVSTTNTTQTGGSGH